MSGYHYYRNKSIFSKLNSRHKHSLINQFKRHVSDNAYRIIKIPKKLCYIYHMELTNVHCSYC